MATFASRRHGDRVTLPQHSTFISLRRVPSGNFIDQILLEEWQRLQLAPSPGCSDETFLRRAYLDTTGLLPSPAQVRSFLGDTRLIVVNDWSKNCWPAMRS